MENFNIKATFTQYNECKLASIPEIHQTLMLNRSKYIANIKSQRSSAQSIHAASLCLKDFSVRWCCRQSSHISRSCRFIKQKVAHCSWFSGYIRLLHLSACYIKALHYGRSYRMLSEHWRYVFIDSGSSCFLWLSINGCNWYSVSLKKTTEKKATPSSSLPLNLKLSIRKNCCFKRQHVRVCAHLPTNSLVTFWL